MSERYEWGIIRNRTGEVHRTSMTEEEAETWIADWRIDGGLPGAFSVIHRTIGDWVVTVPKVNR